MFRYSNVLIMDGFFCHNRQSFHGHVFILSLENESKWVASLYNKLRNYNYSRESVFIRFYLMPNVPY